MYQKEASSNIQKLVFDKFDAAELESLLKPGTFVDAFLSLDPYDYQQHAGIRLVAKKMIIHSEWQKGTDPVEVRLVAKNQTSRLTCT